MSSQMAAHHRPANLVLQLALVDDEFLLDELDLRRQPLRIAGYRDASQPDRASTEIVQPLPHQSGVLKRSWRRVQSRGGM
eukprot:2522146-Pleurochrysis_carterae.AAC.6